MPLSLADLIRSASPEQSYDTPLTPEQEMQFSKWKKRYAPKDSGADYDLRGAFLAGFKPDPKSGHWPDTFKKPNHPTFSEESIYAQAAPEQAGHWHDETYHPRNLVEARPAGATLLDLMMRR